MCYGKAAKILKLNVSQMDAFVEEIEAARVV